VRIEELAWDDWNWEHIQQGEEPVTPDEVEEAVHGDIDRYVRKNGRVYLVYAKTSDRHLLTVLAPRGGSKFYVVTSRPMDDREKRIYRKGGK
jgi:hypothetical protein